MLQPGPRLIVVVKNCEKCVIPRQPDGVATVCQDPTIADGASEEMRESPCIIVFSPLAMIEALMDWSIIAVASGFVSRRRPKSGRL